MPWRRPNEREEIVHIVVTGYQKKKYPRKHYVFVIDVTWNNSDRFEIYRRYSDFFSFQTTLKALFPAAAGRRNEERVIPQLPKRIFAGRSHVARVAEARLEHINRYCQTLISLDPKVSESGHVIGFFSPRIGDKQLPKLHLHRPASLHPQFYPAGSLIEEYCALAEYEAEDESQVSFRSGDKVLVLSKDDSGWWMCKVDEKVGWAPPSYLKKCISKDADSDSEEEYLGLPESYKDSDDSGVGESQPGSGVTSPSYNPSGKGFNVPEIDAEDYKAIDSYEATGEGQVSFEDGETIQVLDKMEDGWWFVSNGREEGWAPCSYLENMTGGEEEDAISSLDIEKYITVDAYTADEDDELSFPKGETVDVLQKSLDGWWLIRHSHRTGLAPATFLKKVEQSSPGDHNPGVVRKITPPPPQQQPNFLVPNLRQQPPRKQSVRLRASMKQKTITRGKSPLATNGAQNQTPNDTRPAVPKSPNRKHEESNLTLPLASSSPVSSDSEVDAAPLQPPKSPRSPRIKRGIQSKIHRFEHRSSESSLSEDNSSSPTPLNFKPPLKPKPIQRKSKSEMDVLPPRPRQIEIANAHRIPQITKDPPGEKPILPQRPTGSVIRRAHEQPGLSSSAFRPIPQRSPSPALRSHSRSPLGALCEESGEESDCSTLSTNSNRLRPPVKQTRSSSLGDITAPSLLPPKPPRGRNVSESEASSLPISTAASAAANPFNQQMAETLIKYILASGDQGLISAIRDVVSADPEAMRAISK